MEGVIYREYAPSAALRGRVACFWTLTGSPAAPARILPDGCMDLLFDLSGLAAAAEPSVVGAMTAAIVSRPSGGRVDLLGVRFEPGEGFGFLDGGDVKAMRDCVVSLRDVWGRSASGLAERLAALASADARIAVLTSELTRRKARPGDARLRRAVSAMRRLAGSVRVADVAGQVGLGERQLERLFDGRVGVGPKTLASVFRMQALLARAATGGDWARLAADLGYCDQGHLARDLRRLAGVTPSELGRAIQALARGVPVDAMSDLSNPPHGPLPMVTP